MTDQENEIILGKFVLVDRNQERKSEACLGQTCFRSSTVFSSQLFVILLIIFDWFWTIYFSRNCHEAAL